MTAAKSNYDPERVTSFIDRIEELDRKKVSKHASYMSECAEINGDKDDVYEEAKGAGIPVKALKRVVKVRSLERKAEAEREKLDQEDQDAFDNLRLALGDLEDTPLGKAAQRASGMPGADAPGAAATAG